jgi:hypothetical protein
MKVFKNYVGAIAASLSDFTMESGGTAAEANAAVQMPSVRFLITELAVCRTLIDHIDSKLNTYMLLKV